MADYSETLWDEFRYGKDAGDEHIEENRQTYLANPADAAKNLVRFYYKNKEDVFDQVSYPKGGSILHMLRNYVGDSAFYKSLNLYLTTNKFKSAEAQQLRLAFEEVTGQDLNWFWNQWYYGSGQPNLTINYEHSDGKARIIIEQTQLTGKFFKLPMAIDVYSEGTNKKRYNVWAANKADTFYFPSTQKPSWINVDADKVLLAKKTDNKSAEEFKQQFKYAGNYLDRKEALAYFAKNKMSDLVNGLNDKYYGLRLFTLEAMDQNKSYTVPTVLNTIEQIAQKDPDKKVQAKAFEILGEVNDKKYQPLFTKYLNDSSYSVSGAALEGLTKLEPTEAYTLAKKYSNDSKGKLGRVVSKVIMENATEGDFDIILEHYKNSPQGQTKVQESMIFSGYLAKVKNSANVRKGVDEIMNFRNSIPEQYRSYIDPGFKQAFSKLSATKKAEGNTELANYIDGLLK
jgi:aminopeptidase N